MLRFHPALCLCVLALPALALGQSGSLGGRPLSATLGTPKASDHRDLLRSLPLSAAQTARTLPLSQAPPRNALGRLTANPFDPLSLANPYGAGSPYKPDGLMNPYSPYGSPYSNRSWTNPYATDPPKLIDGRGNYRGRLSTNPFLPDSIANPSGRYGNPYSFESVRNPYGAGNPYSTIPIYVVPAR